jgi:hypothetical protein
LERPDWLILVLRSEAGEEVATSVRGNEEAAWGAKGDDLQRHPRIMEAADKARATA